MDIMPPVSAKYSATSPASIRPPSGTSSGSRCSDDPWCRRTEWYPWTTKEPNPPGHPFNGLKNFQGEFDWGVMPKAESEYGDMNAVDWAGRFLERPHDKPFFLAAGLWHPHIPMFSPQRYFDM